VYALALTFVPLRIDFLTKELREVPPPF
jgi:hypothetical protein